MVGPSDAAGDDDFDPFLLLVCPKFDEPVRTILVVTRSSFSCMVTKTLLGLPFLLLWGLFVGEFELLEVGDNPFPLTKVAVVFPLLFVEFPKGGLRNRPELQVKLEVFCKGIRSGVKL